MAQPSLNFPYLLLAGVLVISILLAFTVLWPQYQAIQQSRSDFKASQQELQEQRDFIRSIDRKITELQTQQVHEQELDVILPADESFEDALRIFHQTADRTGITINSLNNRSSAAQSDIRTARARGGTTSIPNNITPLAASMNLTGSYQQFRQFIEILEQSIRLMDVTSLRLQRNTEVADQLNGSLDVNFYQYQSTDN